MSSLLSSLRTHIDYTTWASTQLLEAASALDHDELVRDFGTSDHSVLGTMAHVFAADRVWLRRVRGDAQLPFLDPHHDLHLQTLQTEWPVILDGWRTLAEEWTEDSLARGVSYKQFNGQPFTTPLWQVVLHVVNHGTHHRGQAAGFIRAMGQQPPKLDLIFYYRELDEKASAAG